MEKKSRGFFVTCHYDAYCIDNNEEEDDEDFVSRGIRDLLNLKKWAGIFGFHVGAKTHKRHFHAYVQSTVFVRMATVVKAFSDKFKKHCSVEEQRGAVTECKNYIENGALLNVSEQFGVIDFSYKPAGAEIMRKDEEIKEIFEEIRRRNFVDVFIESPLKIYKVGVQCAKEFDNLVHPSLFSFKDDGLKNVVWFFGLSGSGKTFGAESLHDQLYPEDHGKLDVFDASKDNKWWCNVHPTFKTVIVDNVHQISVSSVLHLLISLAQGSFFTAEIKHHSVKLRVELICLTSIEHPMVLYNSMSPLERSAITWPEVLRRVKTIVKCEKKVDFFGQVEYERVIVRDDYKEVAGDLSNLEEQNDYMRQQGMDLNAMAEENHDPYADFKFDD
jgi:hypothetical protein